MKFICCGCDKKRQAFVLVISGALEQLGTFCSFKLVNRGNDTSNNMNIFMPKLYFPLRQIKMIKV